MVNVAGDTKSDPLTNKLNATFCPNYYLEIRYVWNSCIVESNLTMNFSRSKDFMLENELFSKMRGTRPGYFAIIVLASFRRSSRFLLAL